MGAALVLSRERSQELQSKEPVPLASVDTSFAGSIPGLYDRYLVPLLFQPYADEVARRVAEWQPRRILETAAGTGVVTRAMHDAAPRAEIVATDLNPDMLAVAAERVAAGNVRFQSADALDLPFDDGSFDLVVCQFGVMFYPDKVRGNAEARRVLRDGGRYLTVIWDSMARNPGSAQISDAVAALFPDNPPRFLDRTPFGYGDVATIEHDLIAAGFTDIELETVEKRSRSGSAREVALGLCQGSPLRAEIEERDPARLGEAVEAAAAALMHFEGVMGFDAPMSAHLVTARK
jgi:SAM-dependent methyltransferase